MPSLQENSNRIADALEPSIDDDLFDAFRVGDATAFATVRGWVSRVVRHPGWHLADPEATVQDILMKLLDIGRSGRFTGASSFHTFAISVARHTCIDAYRRQRLRDGIMQDKADVAEQASSHASPEQAQVSRERLELLRYVFQKLPEECRKLWILLYGQGMAARDVGARLEITESNVRVRAHRCLQKARGIARSYLAPGA